jgi:hypothetical protein
MRAVKTFLVGLVVALGALLVGVAQAQVGGPIYCGSQVQSAVIVAAATTNLLSPPSGSARTYVCGYTYYTGTVSAATAQLEYGQTISTPCDTNPIALTPAGQLASDAIAGDNAAIFRGIEVPPGNALCLVTAGTTISVAVQVFYARQ